MKITDIVVKKMDHSDARYPDPDPAGKFLFTDVYRLTCTLEDGSEQECPFFFTGDMSFEFAAKMFGVFAAAVQHMERDKAA